MTSARCTSRTCASHPLDPKTGTTTATVLARSIYEEGCKSTAAGINPQEMRKGVQMGVDHVVNVLKGRAKMISTPEEIAQVGRS